MLLFLFYEPESCTDSNNIIIVVSCSNVLVAELVSFTETEKKRKTIKDIATTTTEDV